MKEIRLEGNRFLDHEGREVILHGVNVLARKEPGHIYPGMKEAMPWFQSMGFDLLRFGIFWHGAEPEPGKVDMDYLARVKEVVAEAEKYGIYIILDMHQDLFAQKYIDGAPDWACLDEGLYHPENCNLWYEAYLSSEAIIRAADNFWANHPAADGVGLLDHYEAMWETIAAYFADCPNVVGFEPMNEPFMGSIAREAFGMATMKMLEKNPAFDLQKPDAIPPEQAAEFMGMVAERLIGFDRTTLMDFYRRMAGAIRRGLTKVGQEGSGKAIVTGGNIYCSTDVPTGIEVLGDIPQIYAPHGYDSVVDSDRYDSFSPENVRRIYQHKKEDADRLGIPALVGEWGAFPSKDFTNGLIRQMNEILEQNLWGDTYCEYHPGMEQDPNRMALKKGYPMAAAGRLVAWHDDNAGTLTVSLDAAAGGESILYCPFVPEKITAEKHGDAGHVAAVPVTYTVTALDGGAALVAVRLPEGGLTQITAEGAER